MLQLIRLPSNFLIRKGERESLSVAGRQETLNRLTLCLHTHTLTHRYTICIHPYTGQVHCCWAD